MALFGSVTCRCGSMQLSMSGNPILSSECLCDDCRSASETFAALDNGMKLADGKGATHVILYRKDRLTCDAGAEHLREHRLTPESKTRRIVATCCTTPMFLDFEPGHWVSLYAANVAQEARPRPLFRTFCNDLPEPGILPRDIPNGKPVPLGFVVRRFGAAIAMRFKAPKIGFVIGNLHV